ncbi:DUF1028 domain-containing protein [Euzebya rosea]|uniref:DUF1028 domain-containing protein n=1 Tax=Euzebya rosea TaxID=2052804 RepID=UPI000D3ED5E2|nr:DUF1028 domain-containing protein [Euzebya rosea]
MTRSRRPSLHLSTFSIVGADPDAGDVGVAVQSKFLAVGAIVPWARGGVGAAAVQAFPDVTVGPRALDRLAAGEDPDAVLDALVRADPMASQRQTGLVAADGRAASHTGEDCFDHRGSLVGPGYAVQGNVLAGPEVLAAMATTFLDHTGPLAHRLLAALQAGQDAGGEKRGMESSALVVARPGGGYGGNHDRLVDLRVDHDEDPISRLAELLEVRDFHFDRTPPSAWFPLEGEVRGEVAALLRRGGWLDDHTALPAALMDFMGWENLEERWADDDHVDPVVLAHLRGVHG